jgi:hypothetical protein
MQNHIHNEHPEYYISNLPATEKGFQLIISTPPSVRPPPPAKEQRDPLIATTVIRSPIVQNTSSLVHPDAQTQSLQQQQQQRESDHSQAIGWSLTGTTNSSSSNLTFIYQNMNGDPTQPQSNDSLVELDAQILYHQQHRHQQEQRESSNTSRAFHQMANQPWKSSRIQTSISRTISRDNTGGENARRAELFAEFGKKKKGFCVLTRNPAEESARDDLAPLSADNDDMQGEDQSLSPITPPGIDCPVRPHVARGAGMGNAYVAGGGSNHRGQKGTPGYNAYEQQLFEQQKYEQ